MKRDESSAGCRRPMVGVAMEFGRPIRRVGETRPNAQAARRTRSESHSSRVLGATSRVAGESTSTCLLLVCMQINLLVCAWPRSTRLRRFAIEERSFSHTLEQQAASCHPIRVASSFGAATRPPALTLELGASSSSSAENPSDPDSRSSSARLRLAFVRRQLHFGLQLSFFIVERAQDEDKCHPNEPLEDASRELNLIRILGRRVALPRGPLRRRLRAQNDADKT